jgi:hypothetical protein
MYVMYVMFVMFVMKRMLMPMFTNFKNHPHWLIFPKYTLKLIFKLIIRWFQ